MTKQELIALRRLLKFLYKYHCNQDENESLRQGFLGIPIHSELTHAIKKQLDAVIKKLALLDSSPQQRKNNSWFRKIKMFNGRK